MKWDTKSFVMQWTGPDIPLGADGFKKRVACHVRPTEHWVFEVPNMVGLRLRGAGMHGDAVCNIRQATISLVRTFVERGILGLHFEIVRSILQIHLSELSCDPVLLCSLSLDPRITYTVCRED